jgi:hypothetical protein
MEISQLVEVYVAIRAERDKLKQVYEAEDAALKEDLNSIASSLLVACNTINADSIKTAHGTVMRQMKERYSCSDWDSFYKFVLDNEAVHLLERRVHQGNMKTYIEENSNDGLPPGTSVMREYEISVRKPSK